MTSYIPKVEGQHHVDTKPFIIQCHLSTISHILSGAELATVYCIH